MHVSVIKIWFQQRITLNLKAQNKMYSLSAACKVYDIYVMFVYTRYYNLIASRHRYKLFIKNRLTNTKIASKRKSQG